MVIWKKLLTCGIEKVDRLLRKLSFRLLSHYICILSLLMQFVKHLHTHTHTPVFCCLYAETLTLSLTHTHSCVLLPLCCDTHTHTYTHAHTHIYRTLYQHQ